MNTKSVKSLKVQNDLFRLDIRRWNKSNRKYFIHKSRFTNRNVNLATILAIRIAGIPIERISRSCLPTNLNRHPFLSVVYRKKFQFY